MAIPIKSVPTLRGKVAEAFVRNANKAAEYTETTKRKENNKKPYLNT